MIETLGLKVILACHATCEIIFLFGESLLRIVQQVFLFRLRGREILGQMFSIGVESLPVVAFSLTFVSLMLILEFSFHMKLVLRQDSLVPAFSTVLMLRELGPVVTCLLLTSRIGASIAAEIGTMNVTEQIDALRLLSIDPVEFLVVPRWIACVFATVSLSVVAVATAILCGASLASVSLGSTSGQYFNSMFVFARFSDVTGCITKAAVFGTIIPIVAAYHGFHCRRGSEGVGEASTRAVVQGSMLIIVADFLLTYFLYAV